MTILEYYHNLSVVGLGLIIDLEPSLERKFFVSQTNN